MKHVKILIFSVGIALTLQASEKQKYIQQAAQESKTALMVEQLIKNRLESLKQEDFDQGMSQLLQGLPYDILALEQWKDHISSGGEFVFTPGTKETVAWRLSVFIRFIPEIRKFLEDYETSLALLYAFISTYPKIAGLPRVQRLFELAMDPQFKSWRDVVFETQVDGLKFIEERLRNMQKALAVDDMTVFAQELNAISETFEKMWEIFVNYTYAIEERVVRKKRKAQIQPESEPEEEVDLAAEATYTREFIDTVQEALKNLDWNFPEFVKMRADIQKIFIDFMLRNVPLGASVKR